MSGWKTAPRQSSSSSFSSSSSDFPILFEDEDENEDEEESKTTVSTRHWWSKKIICRWLARFLLNRRLALPLAVPTKPKSVMATSVKSKFAGFLRGLLQRGDDRTPGRPVVSAASPPASALPAASASASNFSAPPRAANADEIELPLAAVVAALPLDLRAKLMAAPPTGLTIRLAAETVISQLAFGMVKISFGELRQLAPGILVNSGGELDNKLVSLPLGEILPRINPALLARRAVKKVEVAAEITGPFANRGRGFSFTTQPLKVSATPPPATKREPEPPAAFIPPVSPQFPMRSTTPATPANGNGNAHS